MRKNGFKGKLWEATQRPNRAFPLPAATPSKTDVYDTRVFQRMGLRAWQGKRMSCPPEAVRPAGNETGPVFFLDQRDQHAGRREPYDASRTASGYAPEVGKLARHSPIGVGILPLA
jgi:hypothetical protein